MKQYRTTLAAVLFGALTLSLAGPALADRDHHGPSGHGWGHHKHHHKHHNHHRHGREVVYYSSPVIIRQPAPVIVPQPVYYEPAYYYDYAPRRNPALVIGVDIPLR